MSRLDKEKTKYELKLAKLLIVAAILEIASKLIDIVISLLK